MSDSAHQAAEAEASHRADVAKTAVLHAMSHDLRSPLTAITTAAGGLSGDSVSPGDREELVAVVEMEAARLSRLVDDLLDLSRIQAGRGQPDAGLVRPARRSGQRGRPGASACMATMRSSSLCPPTCRWFVPIPFSSSESSRT